MHAYAPALARSAWQRSPGTRRLAGRPTPHVTASHSDTSFGTSKRTTCYRTLRDLLLGRPDRMTQLQCSKIAFATHPWHNILLNKRAKKRHMNDNGETRL